MSKSNIRNVEQSGGELKFNRHFEITVSDQGNGDDNIDFSLFTFEDERESISHIEIINDGGTNDVFFVFDALGSTIDTSDNSTYNGKAYAIGPYTEIDYSGVASSIGFRCASGLSTTLKILVW